ncbi:hypothetical protein EDC18_10474 [Natranaerovirga pectinivora]|uniref:Uncharacterized protein n=1 Tax=Natranaerovirga pectinivora TaxID=682400 RepID=A0A4R3MLE1_9FIRM|nr:hypothetical protein [Natranaerovirga pectinivora]TCT14924.1 hypothetical protein EDC18_10474 [Natranaerovirga pectinivora]
MISKLKNLQKAQSKPKLKPKSNTRVNARNSGKSTSRSSSRSSSRSGSRSSSRSRRDYYDEPPLNFFKVKVYFCVVILIFVIVIHQFQFNIGNFTSEKLYDMLYYNEEIETLSERFMDSYDQTIRTFWSK